MTRSLNFSFTSALFRLIVITIVIAMVIAIFIFIIIVIIGFFSYLMSVSLAAYLHMLLVVNDGGRELRTSVEQVREGGRRDL